MRTITAEAHGAGAHEVAFSGCGKYAAARLVDSDRFNEDPEEEWGDLLYTLRSLELDFAPRPDFTFITDVTPDGHEVIRLTADNQSPEYDRAWNEARREVLWLLDAC